MRDIHSVDNEWGKHLDTFRDGIIIGTVVFQKEHLFAEEGGKWMKKMNNFRPMNDKSRFF